MCHQWVPTLGVGHWMPIWQFDSVFFVEDNLLRNVQADYIGSIGGWGFVWAILALRFLGIHLFLGSRTWTCLGPWVLVDW